MLRRIMILGAIVVAVTGMNTAQAGLIPTLAGAPTPDGGNPGFFDWIYNIDLGSGEGLTGNSPATEFITLSSFDGYKAGSATVLAHTGPVGAIWTPSEVGTSITFTYSGGVTQTGPITQVVRVELLSSQSQVNPLSTPYSAGTTSPTNGSPQTNTGTVDGPTSVPEPSQYAMAALMGAGGLYHWLRRRKAAKA
jgi:hypothetical protein